MSGAGESEYTLTVGMFGLNAVSNTGDYALAVGDRIVSINGTEIRSAVQIYNELAQVAAMGVSGSVVVNEGAANESEVSYVESVFVVMREIDGVPMRVTLTRARTPFRTESSGEQSHIRDFFVQTAYEFVVIRNGERVTLPNVTFPAAPNSRGGISCVDDFRVFGIFEEQKTFVNVMSYSFRDCVSMGRIIWLSLADLLRGTYGLNDLSGPVGIGAAVSGAAEHTENFGEMIMMIVYISAFITINLGVVNLLPIPALDGGRLIFLTLEGIRRKPIKQEYETIIHVVGLVLLILLIVVITFNDIRNLFAG
jgi:membrane-associated protease RseP (regulator of RpoE activity)